MFCLVAGLGEDIDEEMVAEISARQGTEVKMEDGGHTESVSPTAVAVIHRLSEYVIFYQTCLALFLKKKRLLPQWLCLWLISSGCILSLPLLQYAL